MATTPSPAPVNPKQAAIIAVVIAVLGAAVLWFPALKPVCQALGGCADPVPAANVQLP